MWRQVLKTEHFATYYRVYSILLVTADCISLHCTVLQSTVLHYLQENKTDWLYITLKIKNLLWNFGLKWFLCEGCLKWKFLTDRFLNFRFLYAGFYSIVPYIFNAVNLGSCQQAVSSTKGTNWHGIKPLSFLHSNTSVSIGRTCILGLSFRDHLLELLSHVRNFSSFFLPGIAAKLRLSYITRWGGSDLLHVADVDCPIVFYSVLFPWCLEIACVEHCC